MHHNSFEYTFSVWPDETWRFDQAVFSLFEMLNGRIQKEFTEDEFERFRSALSHNGITLREIERIPHLEPEHVS